MYTTQSVRVAHSGHTDFDGHRANLGNSAQRAGTRIDTYRRQHYPTGNRQDVRLAPCMTTPGGGAVGKPTSRITAIIREHWRFRVAPLLDDQPAATFWRTMFSAEPALNHSTCSGLNVCTASKSTVEPSGLTIWQRTF